MKLMKLLAAFLAVLGALVAAPAAQAHFSLNGGGTGAAPVWLGGAVTPFLPGTATVPSNGYLGIHSATNDRVLQTGQYVAGGSLTTAELGGVFGNSTPRTNETIEGQRFTYNAGPSSDITTPLSISVGQDSWQGGVGSATQAGLSWSNPHFSSGTGNPELNLKNSSPGQTEFINITVGDDPLFAGSNQLAFTLFQGWVQGAGLTGLNALYTGTATTVGQDLGVTLALTGNNINGEATAGEYTIVVGDQSTIGSNPTFDGHYRLALEVSGTAAYNNVVSAVPVPGAVWLFGSAMAGLIGFGRRKQIAV